MPRKTPVRELQKEETVGSPLRRSSRISNNSPVPTKVVSRRNSATETSTSTAKVSRSRRSLSQEAEPSEVEVEKKTVKTTRTRRASNTEEESSTKGKSSRGPTPEPKRPVTRRRRSLSQDPEIAEEEPTKKDGKSRSSSTNKNESVEDSKIKKKPAENGHVADSAESESESESAVPKKKRVDLDLSVIKETSLTEEDIESSEETKAANKELEDSAPKQDPTEEKMTTQNEIIVTEENKEDEKSGEETVVIGTETEIAEDTTKPVQEKDSEDQKKSNLSPVREAIVIIEDFEKTAHKRKLGKFTTQEQNEITSVVENGEKKESEKDTTKEQNESIAVVENGEKKKPEKDTIKEQNESTAVVENAGKKEPEKDTSKVQNESTTVVEIGEEKEPEKDTTKEQNAVVENGEKKEAEKDTTEEQNESTPVVENAGVDVQKSDETSFLKENPSMKEISDASFSDNSFQLQLSTSLLDDVNKTDGNVTLSPTSNKENVCPDKKKPEEPEEPMEVDESFSEIPSPNKISRRSLNLPKAVKLDDVEKNIEIAEKATNEIALFLTEDVKHKSDEIQSKLEKTDSLLIADRVDDFSKENEQRNSLEMKKSSNELGESETRQEKIQKSTKQDSHLVTSNEKSEEEDCRKQVSEENEESEKPINKSTEVEEPSLVSSCDGNLSVDEEIINLDETAENESFKEPTPQKTDLDKKLESKDEEIENSQINDTSLKSSNVSSTLLQTENEKESNTVDLVEQSSPDDIASKTIEEDGEKSPLIKSKEKQNEDQKISESLPVPLINIIVTSPRSVEISINKNKGDGTDGRLDASETSSASLEENNISVKTNEELEVNTLDNEAAITIEDSNVDDVQSQESDLEKKSRVEDDEEIVIDIDDTIESDEKENDDEERTNRTVKASKNDSNSSVETTECAVSLVDDNEESPFASKTTHQLPLNEPSAVKSHEVVSDSPEIKHTVFEPSKAPEVVILSDNETVQDDEDEEENEVKFVKETMGPIPSDDTPIENDLHDATSTEKDTVSPNSSKRWLDKTLFVVQENIKAEEDKEKGLRNKIHRVVDLFCSEINGKGDVSINVSLECTVQCSDNSDPEESVTCDVVQAAVPASVEEGEPPSLVSQKGSKRRKIYKDDYVAEFSETSENELHQTEHTSRDKTRKLHKKSKKKTKNLEQESPSKKKINDETSPTTVESPKKEVSPKKKSKKQKFEKEPSPKKKAKKHHEETVMHDENEDKKKRKQKQRNQNILEEDTEIAPIENENVIIAAVSSEEQEYSSPFADYFSSVFGEQSEDEDDVTYLPDCEIISSDSDLDTDQSYETSFLDDEELSSEEVEEPPLKTDMKKNKKGKTTGNQRLKRTDADGVGGSSGSDDVFMGEELAQPKSSQKIEKSEVAEIQQNTSKSKSKKIEACEDTEIQQNTSKSKRKKQKSKSKQQNDDEETHVVSPKTGRTVKLVADTAENLLTEHEKKHKKRKHFTYDVSDEELIPERKIKKKETSSKKLVSEKVNLPEKTKKVPNVKTKLVKGEPKKKSVLLKPSTFAAAGWEVETI